MSELIVVTVVVAAEGGVKVPKITSREELTKALNKLGALRSEQVQLCHEGHVVCCSHVLCWCYMQELRSHWCFVQAVCTIHCREYG